MIEQINTPKLIDAVKMDDSFMELMTNMNTLRSKNIKGFDLFLAILNTMQYQFKEALENGTTIKEYRCVFDDNEFSKFIKLGIKEMPKPTNYSNKRIIEMKMDACYKFVKNLFVKETSELNSIEGMASIYSIFTVDVVYNLDYSGVKEYIFTTTEKGTKWANNMFTYLKGTSYSYYLIGLGCGLPTMTSKRLLALICRYYQAIIQGRWANGGNVVFKLEKVYKVCNLTSINNKVNKDNFLKALDEINKGLELINAVDRDGYPINICVKYLRNDEYGNDYTISVNRERYIQFYTKRVGDTPITSGGQGTIQELIGIDDSKYKTV